MSWCRREVVGGDALVTVWSLSAVMNASLRRLAVVAVVWLVMTSLADLTDGFVVEPATSPQRNINKLSSTTGFAQLTSNLRRTRRKTSPGRPASCSCTCETMMVPQPQPHHQQQQQDQQQDSTGLSEDYPSDWTPGDQAIDDETVTQDNGDQFITGQSLVDDTVNIDRYSGSWGHEVRYPWTRLPDHMCFRDPCETDFDCCRRFNLCDRSAHVCVDCWYGSPCSSQAQCCLKYPTCRLQAVYHANGDIDVDSQSGTCVDE